MKPIAIIDCAINNPSYNCMNKLIENSTAPFTYHWVSGFGCDSLDFIDQASGYIIFGSDSNVCDRLPWQIDLARRMKEKIENNIPVMGICFGHQLMADAYGAKVDLVTPGNDCFEGTRKQKILTSSHGFEAGEEIEVFITHHYEVKNLPNEFIHLGTSTDCKFDSLAHKTKPYFSLQGHPEASRHFVQTHMDRPISEEAIIRALKSGNKVIQKFIDLCRSNY